MLLLNILSIVIYALPAITSGLAPDLDAPIQIVRPSEDHAYLETVPEGLDYLRSLEDPIAVISTLGAIHSGKSYLINQLLQKQIFPVGYTIRPETCGIWLARYPYDHLGTRVLFVDTEGLFSPDAQGTYDVKLFAIATLISSEVIYNTVKFIDSQQVEALETLIRRTNLFGLRAYARQHDSEAKEVSNVSLFLRALVPSQLSWVVQDFIQDLDGLTPEEWLRSLLDRTTYNHENKTYPTQPRVTPQVNHVANYFTKVDCVTLPLPSADSTLLMKLDQVPSEQLEPEYIRSVTEFRQRLLDRASKFPKAKGVTSKGDHDRDFRSGSRRVHMSGADLADLLQFLVAASNTRSSEERESPFPELPSIADQFTTLQLKLMKTDILTILEKDLMAAVKAAISMGRPMSKRRFDEEMRRATSHARELWDQVMLGIINTKSHGEASQGAESEFGTALIHLQDTVRARNCQMVSEWCQNFLGKCKSECSDGIEQLYASGPHIPDEFDVKLSQLQENILAKFTKALTGDVSGLPPDCCNVTKYKLETELQRVIEDARQKNTDLIAQMVDDITATLITIWQKHVSNINLDKIEENELRADLHELARQLTEDFEAKTRRYTSLTGVVYKHNSFKAQLEEFFNQTLDIWKARCVAIGEQFLKDQVTRYALDLRWAVNIPVTSETLKSIAETQADRLRHEFRSKVICADSEIGGKKLRQDLEDLIKRSTVKVEDENDRVYLEIVQGSLIATRDRLMAEVDSYYNPASFKQAAMKLATEGVRKALIEAPPQTYQRDESKPNKIDNETVLRCATKYVNENLQQGVTQIWATLAAILAILVAGFYFTMMGATHFVNKRQSKGLFFFGVAGLVVAGGWHIRSVAAQPLYYLACMHPGLLLIPILFEIVFCFRISSGVNEQFDPDTTYAGLSSRQSLRGMSAASPYPPSQARYSEASAKTSYGAYQTQTPYQNQQYARMSAPISGDHSLFKPMR